MKVPGTVAGFTRGRGHGDVYDVQEQEAGLAGFGASPRRAAVALH